MPSIRKFSERATQWFALFALAGGAMGLVFPTTFASLVPSVPLLLGIIMFGMGLTLRPRDFRVVLRHPQAALIGIVAQYAVMPLLGWCLATAFDFRAELFVGMILVGAAPGGTASNVLVYLAKGDVALSVAMTSVSTLLAPLLTPLLVLWLAGSVLPVAASDLFVGIVQIVLAPVILGIIVRRFLSSIVDRALTVLPLVSIIAIMLVIAAVAGANAGAVRTTGALLLVAVVIHNAVGLFLGYLSARFARLNKAARRAISFEVGAQNSGLASALAAAHFGPLAALPGAVFSIWYTLPCALLASWWSRRPVPNLDEHSRREVERHNEHQ